jgi:hypothetical protein
MRVRIALIPFVAAAALLAGCATNNNTTAPAATTPPAGNGIAALSADEILAKAKTALAAAKSYHVKGQATSDGSLFKADIAFAGKDFGGTVQIQNIPLEIISVTDGLYLKAADSFWASVLPPAQQALAAGFKDKYVKVNPSVPAFAGLKDSFDGGDMLTPEGTVSKGDTKTINGVPAIGLVDSKTKSVLYIATEGEPFPLRQEGGEGGPTDVIDFTDFNGTASVKAPAAANVVDLTAFTG